jgi:hypothetical protein
MKKIILSLIACISLNTYTFSYDHLKQGFINGTIGSALLAAATYSAGETLLDCGHGYYELKKEYLRYLLELETLEHSYIMTSTEKHFWAVNQMLSRVPKVFWREIIAGTFTLFAGVLAYKQLGKSIHELNKAF